MEEPLYPLDPVLVVDDDEMVLRLMSTFLTSGGFSNVALCRDGREVKPLLEQKKFSAVLLDLTMPYVSGVDLLPVILQTCPQTPVIVVTAVGDLQVAVDCMKAGAFDYLVKPADMNRLRTSLKHAVEHWEAGNENRELCRSLFSRSVRHPDAFASIITRSAAMHTVFRYVEAIAATSLPILITGETGVGKELVARSIHTASGRPGDFVAVNVAGLDDTLFADTLFGHLKGAFTSAMGAREGMIRKAARGTLFLDEIGDLSLDSQIKILRLIQEKEYYPLGSDSPLVTDARFIFATHHNLPAAVREDTFRHDLFYRLQSHHIHIPPLRDRPEDIPLLVDHFLGKMAADLGKKLPRLPAEIHGLMEGHAFPGNVRELEGLVSDIVVRSESGAVPIAPVRERLKGGAGLADEAFAAETGEGVNLFRHLERLPPLRQATRALVDEAMRRAGGNQTRAAQLLGMSRTTLNKRLRKSPSDDAFDTPGATG